MSESTAPSFVGVNLEDIPPVLNVDPGEWLVRVEDVKERTSEKGSTMLVLQLSFQENVDAEHLFDNLVLPRADSSEKAVRFLLRRLKAACEAFGVDWSAQGFDPRDFIGQEATIQVDIEQYQGENRNVVKNYTASNAA